MARRFVPLRNLAIVMIAMFIAQCAASQARPRSVQAPQPVKTTSKDAQRFVGVWTAEFMETTFLRIELKLVDGRLAGTIATGDIHTAEDGRLTDVSAAEKGSSTPILDVALRGDTLAFKRRDGDDTDDMQMTLTGNGMAELRFVFPQAEGAPKIQPFQLTRRIER